MDAEQVTSLATSWGLKILIAIVIFYVGRIVVNWVVKIVRAVLEKQGMDSILVSFLCSILRWVLLLFVVIAALSQLGIDTTSLVAGQQGSDRAERLYPLQ